MTKEIVRQIRVRPLKDGFFGHNGTVAVEAKTKALVIQAIKAEMPGDYIIVDIPNDQKAHS